MTDVDKRIGETLRILRVKVGMSQKDLAKLIGVMFQQCQKYECAGNRIAASTLYRISKALEIPMAHFFGEVDAGYFHDKKMRELIFKVYRMPEKDRKLVIKLVNRLA